MTKRIKQLCSELKTELEKEKIKLALYGNDLILVDDTKEKWDDTYMKVDTEMQNSVYFDFPVY